MTASATVRIVAGLVLVLALLGAVVYLDRSSSPNLGTVMMLLSTTVTGLLNYLKTSAVKEQQNEVADKVNGNFDRANRIGTAALAELPPAQAHEVLRRFGGPHPPEASTVDKPDGPIPEGR